MSFVGRDGFGCVVGFEGSFLFSPTFIGVLGEATACGIPFQGLRFCRVRPSIIALLSSQDKEEKIQEHFG